MELLEIEVFACHWFRSIIWEENCSKLSVCDQSWRKLWKTQRIFMLRQVKSRLEVLKVSPFILLGKFELP